ncbi:MAG: SDR family oxidoreductase [Armatimonadetes bacterium]|nr:SDR family oxidoreductase [Armatimonadota bacterium]
MRQLQGKTAVITGAGGGIGGASAKLFACEGAFVVAADINPESARQVAASIRAEGGQAEYRLADMTDAAQASALIDRVLSASGKLDILFNVAGISGRRFGDGPVDECTEEGWEKVCAANLKSVYLGCKYAVRAMLQGGGGAIINLASVLGMVGGDEDFATHAYAASKGGIIALSRAMAVYYAPKGIRVNVIAPGLIATPMSQRAQQDEGIRQRIATLQPLTGAFGQPEDIARAALYLASDASAFVTGVVLPVDGGWTAR